MDYLVDRGLRAIWVNNGEGCLGRFGVMGVDVHRTISDMVEGEGECLCCTHGRTGPAEWELFKSAMLEHHGVDLKDEPMPGWVIC